MEYVPPLDTEGPPRDISPPEIGRAVLDLADVPGSEGNGASAKISYPKARRHAKAYDDETTNNGGW